MVEREVGVFDLPGYSQGVYRRDRGKEIQLAGQAFSVDRADSLLWYVVYYSDLAQERRKIRIQTARLHFRESMMDKILDTTQDCVFWKDTQRRFVGVNKAFLSAYGIDSVDKLVGKTDEDMGWHSNPEPFKNDEMEVLKG
ncbi:MAG: hypothetical protein IJV04_08410 [Lachnospiraceae bacterium]|nr:hypothetical protein [Lachnospiraceae bacterium]